MYPPSLQKLSRAMFPASPGGQELAGVPMSIPNPVFDSAPEPNSGQNLPEVKLIQDKPQGGANLHASAKNVGRHGPCRSVSPCRPTFLAEACRFAPPCGLSWM